MLAELPFAPMDPVPDNIALINNRVNEVVNTLSWQMAYAKDQAEFDRLRAEIRGSFPHCMYLKFRIILV
jgi:hypothetical protein